MGQKVNPHGLRVGVIKDWDSKWYADDEFADYLSRGLQHQKVSEEETYMLQVFPRLKSKEHLTE